MKLLSKPNFKFYYVLVILIISLVVIPSNSRLDEVKTNEFTKFTLSHTNPTIKLFQSNNSFWYRLTIAINITKLLNDNATLEYFTGGDIINLHVIDTQINFTARALSSYATLRLFNTSSNGLVEGYYKLSVGKRTLYPGMYHPLIEFVYNVALFTMKDVGIPESLGKIILFFIFIIITALIVYFLYKLRKIIRKMIENNNKLDYYNLLFYIVLFSIIIFYCCLFLISSNGMYF